jgi:hypothetical protein
MAERTTDARPAIFHLAPTLILAQQIAALVLESGLTDDEESAALSIAGELVGIRVIRESAPRGS